MPRRLRNWNYRHVTDFLKENGFSYHKPMKGSHQDWIKRGKNGEPDRHVEVSIPKDSYLTNTLKTMIRKSGIAQDVWIKWGSA